MRHLKIDSPPSPELFLEWMQKGLGRALIAVENFGPERYRDIIRHACKDDLLIDGLYGGSRTEYVFHIIMTTGEVEEYGRYLQELLRQSPEFIDYWHVFELATRLASAGQDWLKTDVYTAWEKNAGDPEDDGRLPGDEDLIRMDGMAAFLKVSARVAPAMQPGEKPTGALFELEALEESLGKTEARKQLRNAARNNAWLRSILSAVAALRRERARGQYGRIYPGRQSYRQIKAMIQANPVKAKSYSWRWQVHKATNRTMRKLARAALREKRPEIRTPLLECFRDRPFPLNVERLLPLVTSDDARLARAALRIAARKRHAAIRALALNLLQQPETRNSGAELLVHNFKISDLPILERLAAQPGEPHEYHALAIDLRRIARSNPGQYVVPMLMSLYENGYCAMCRSSVVDLLIELRAVPNGMIEECRHDSDADTRKAIAAYAAGK